MYVHRSMDYVESGYNLMTKIKPTIKGDILLTPNLGYSSADELDAKITNP